MVARRIQIIIAGTGVKQLENENHLLLIIILLLAVAAFVVGDSNNRSSEKSGGTVEANGASQSIILGH
ncbi:MAG: hypothetical protein CVV42_02400 [Candidatus Riflebacteria bacterium HGW-Riflebacteria-2]|nr:MAG: hypothetical protein CVV42_02400 [Candidatus Riflebacteria bacterium HGW-Riflebacteria-2]